MDYIWYWKDLGQWMAAIASTLPPPPQPPQQQQMVTTTLLYLPFCLSSFTPFLPNPPTTQALLYLYQPQFFLLSPTPLSWPILLHTRRLARDHPHLHLLATQGDPLFPIRATDPLGLQVVTGVATRVEEVATQGRATSRAQEEVILKEEVEGAGGTQL